MTLAWAAVGVLSLLLVLFLGHLVARDRRRTPVKEWRRFRLLLKQAAGAKIADRADRDGPAL